MTPRPYKPRDAEADEVTAARRAKAAEKARRYHAANREKCNARSREWYLANKEKARAYYDANREKITARERERYHANREKIIPRMRAYKEANKEKLAAYSKKYDEENREKKNAATRAWRAAGGGKSPEEIGRNNERRNAWRKRNSGHFLKWAREYAARKRKEDPNFAMRDRLRRRVRSALLAKGAPKRAKTMDLVGCSIDDLRSHIESLFQTGMSWENMREWHVDHIVPCAAFDLTIESEQRKCFHYTNLQPLWAKDNLRKSKKLPHEWRRESA